MPQLGWLMGFEPTTPGTTNRCSHQLSYSHHQDPAHSPEGWPPENAGLYTPAAAGVKQVRAAPTA